MKAKLPLFIAIAVLGLGGYAYTQRKTEPVAEIEFRYAAVEKGELLRSISATGQVVALTKVDVKSQAGGKIVRLAVDEGSIVRKGDLVAVIDPQDTQTLFEQANADLQSANARADQAAQNMQLQIVQAENDVREAQVALDAAKARYRRASIESRRQPAVTQATISNAEAGLRRAEADLQRFREVTALQIRREAQANLSQAKQRRDTENANLARSLELEKKGYVAGQQVDLQRATTEQARTAYSIAEQRSETVEQEIRTQLMAQEQQVALARSGVEQARANVPQIDIARVSAVEAEKSVRSAEIALKRAIDNRMQIQVRRSEVAAARASTVRNRVSVRNAQVQLDNTNVIAPRDGVVTMKYVEEGTVVPPGISTFAEGTSLVQISDVTQLYVECAVDEADIANVKNGQKVRITAEAYPGQTFDGVVTRVNPAATTEQNITAVKVRVKVMPGAKVQVLPGMNVTCEFITLDKKGILVAPSQAVQVGEGGKGTVRVKGADPKKPETREVVLGETGNEGIEIVSGLKPGDEVVTAEINLAELREIQKKMQEAQEGGGLAGGGRPGGGGNRRPAGGGGGARR